MKVTELKNWNALTPEEQARLKEVYNVEDEQLPQEMTKTMAEKPPKKEGGQNA